MRIPLIPNLSTKEGEVNKNARMTNSLSEKNPTGTVLCAVRPGLEKLAESVGNGNGIVEFNGKLLSVYGATLAEPVIPDRIGYGEEEFRTGDDGSVYARVLPISCSSDGSVLVGNITTNENLGSLTTRAAIWNSTSETWSILPTISDSYEYPESSVKKVSSDGLTVIGTSTNNDGTTVPFIWTENSGTSAIAGFSNSTVITDVNSDCTAFCGFTNSIGFIWEDGVGVTTFTISGKTASPVAISDNGDVVGNYSNNSTTNIFRRSNAGSIIVLGDGAARCISNDGSVFFGYSGIQPDYKPFKWTDTDGLVLLSNDPIGAVVSCSDDGSICVGGISGNNFYYWTANTGIVNIDVTSMFGFDLVVDNMIYVSGDGRTIVGHVENAGDTDLTTFIWQFDFEPDITLDINKGVSNLSKFVPVVSEDGWVLFYSVIDVIGPPIQYTMYRWTRDTGSFRSIAALEDKFFDFVQSTL